ncbi:LCP family protein [Candidatus Peregrinibacteria bacterium]|jgi:polyisoprenyl-teichoic acid--peptidoglycan teichoic acid transferase|nr:LCP family protein [Candidatus Peregrinibacteria bacterium]
MSFKVKKIRNIKHIHYKRVAKKALKRHAKKLKKHVKFKNLTIIISALIVLLFAILVFKVFIFVKELSFKDVFLSLLNRPAETDEYNHTNFLLLGRGGGIHDGANLTDTIMIASFDINEKKVGVLSIPRDLWVKTEEVGDTRINKIVELSLDQGHTEEYGLELLRSTIEEIIDVPIHYYALIDFKGFEEVIDDIGGVEVEVPEKLYDPFYPKDGTYEFEPFSIDAGKRILDGETALKYVRSRKTTSDFDRARRQNDVLKAAKEKLISTKVLFSKNKLKKLYQTYQDNVSTNLQPYEFIYLGRQTSGFNTENIAHAVINDDPYTIGGFVYTPERQYYGGAFVLVPQTNTLEELQRFAMLTLYRPDILIEDAPIHMLNGTKTANLAYDTLTHLERYGFDIIRYGNSEEKISQTEIYLRKPEAYSETVRELEIIFNTEAKDAEGTIYDEAHLTTGADVIVVVGEEYTHFKEENPKLFY